jgi:hypothetical protein
VQQGLPLTVNDHAGRLLISQDADGIYTLPSINTNANGATAGATDYNNLNNIGATFIFTLIHLQLMFKFKQMVWINSQAQL